MIDDGIGIAEADLDRVFLPFERLGATISEIEGTGVGTAISQRLAVAMDGRIEVSSVVGWGNTFRLLLPPADARNVPAPGDLSQGTVIPAARKGRDLVLTVLSIEDNPANIRLVQEIVHRTRLAAHQRRAGPTRPRRCDR